MRRRIEYALAAPAAALILLLCGCPESTATEADLAPADEPVAQSRPAEAPQPAQATGTSSAYGAAKRSAENTVEKVNQRQQELEKALEDDE